MFIFILEKPTYTTFLYNFIYFYLTPSVSPVSILSASSTYYHITLIMINVYSYFNMFYKWCKNMLIVGAALF